MTQERLLVVEDDDTLRGHIAAYLRTEGYEVLEAGAAASAKSVVETADVDLIVLDVRLPDGDGFDLLRELRMVISTPVIMLTGRDTPSDRIVGLELGADDYVGKPFEFGELRARIRSVLRRTQHIDEHELTAPIDALVFGGWTVDLTHRRLMNPSNRQVPLTSGEYDLLRVLAEHPKRPLSRDQLLDYTRSREWTPFDRSVDVLIGRLRRKMIEHGDVIGLIKTVRHIGYTLATDVRRRRLGAASQLTNGSAAHAS
ncbi:MAG TPA: response regulator transcription factor [Dongiaceae bacterium]|jgi:two-component system OmpR family response regulator